MSDDNDIPESPESEDDNGSSSTPLPEGVSLVTIEEEMKRSYLDYAMSVIVSRAIPDVRDGVTQRFMMHLFAWRRTSPFDFLF